MFQSKIFNIKICQGTIFKVSTYSSIRIFYFFHNFTNSLYFLQLKKIETKSLDSVIMKEVNGEVSYTSILSLSCYNA